MNGKLTYGLGLILGILSLVTLFANMALISSNRHVQDNINQRQAEINKGNSLNSLNQGLVQALAEAAINGHDSAAKDLLAAQGITVQENKAGAATAKPPASSK